MDLGLKDKLIVVTGGGAGIGAGITRACLDEGARVSCSAAAHRTCKFLWPKWNPPP